MESKGWKLPFGGRKESEKQKRLKSWPLKQSDFKVDREVLARDGVKHILSYAGVIPSVPLDVDVTNRTEVLRIIDAGKSQGKIPVNLNHAVEAIICITKSRIKLLRRQGEQELLSVATQDIAFISYVLDEGYHILTIKYGSPENCDLAVLFCDEKVLAEGICSLHETCFQMLYEEVVTILLDEVIPDDFASSNSKYSPTITPNSSIPDYPPDDVSIASGISGTQAKLVKDYMMELSSHFTIDELSQFAVLFKEVNNHSSEVPFKDTCQKLYTLYGEQRKDLLTGLCPFISEKNYPYFTAFLKKNEIITTDVVDGTLSSRDSYPGIFTRSISDIADQSFDDIMDEISTKFQRLDASMGSVNSSYLNS